MDKKLRERLKEKYHGNCAFCGQPLGKGWHTWDIEPDSLFVAEDGSMSKVSHSDDNYLPACKPCGSLRIRSTSHKMTIEEFREEVKESFYFLRTGGITATSYGRSIRFGLIVETGVDVEFYFEKIQRQANP